MTTNVLNLKNSLGSIEDEIDQLIEKDPVAEAFFKALVIFLDSSWGESMWKYLAPPYIEAITAIYKGLALPDFQSPTPLAEGVALRQFDRGTKTYVLIPNHLQLGTRLNGKVDFKLDLIRSSQPEYPPEPHGRLDLRVKPHYHMEKALQDIRSLQSESRLIKPIFAWGYLHVQPQGQTDLPEKIQPLSMFWNGLSTGRIVARLSPQTSSFLKDSLEHGGILPLQAVAETLVIGVSPRVPVYVHLDPIDLLRKLRNELMNSDGLLSRKDVVRFFLKSKEELESQKTNLGLKKIDFLDSSEEYVPQNFAEAMADRVFFYFGNFVPSPTVNSGPYIKLDAPEEFESSQSAVDAIKVVWSKFWMLNVPMAVGRMYWLPLNMAEAGQQLENQEVVEEMTVPALLDGKVRVQILVNVPSPRQGVDTLGIRIFDTPNVDRDISLPASGDPDPVDLKFPPKRGNTYEYQYETHSLLKGQDGNQQSDPQSHTVTDFDDDFVYLSPDDFPIAFIPIEASTDLLEQATVQGQLKSSGGQIPFQLSSSQPVISLAKPKDKSEGTLKIELHSITGVGVGVVEVSLPAKGTQLTPYNFREFGPQNVEIHCTPRDLVTYEFQREGEEGDSNCQSLWFTSDITQKTLTYSSYSLFQYRFRYRRQGENNWSDYISPFQPLTLNP